jgi:hypothetical protein
VWDKEASGEPTKKITAQNFAAAIKTLASLLGTGDVVNDLTSVDSDKPVSANVVNTVHVGTISAATNATVINSMLKKQLNIVYARATVQKSVTSGQWNAIATIENGYRPSGIINFPVIDGTNDTIYEGKIESDGVVSVWPTRSGVMNLSFLATYIQ